ncbi:MAG TPA: diacylglycerol kinase family protein [Solirubrobacterales bacterium]|nr:diacylglycerol kinase family protein [Solirubrobacterales bacterium]
MRRLAALISLLGAALGALLAVYAFVANFPHGAIVFVSTALALAICWWGLLRRGLSRLTALVLAALLLLAGLVLIVTGAEALLWLVVLVAAATSVAAARVAFRAEHRLPPATPPSHPVLFVNRRSGGGKATQAGLSEAARDRGFEVVELEPGEDLEPLARAAVGRGADGLALAGGDGSQAVVATIAAEHDLPYACIPSGTRNHFALDLGVDREDVVGALDAFVDGGERLVDLGEVNGRVFVNNVSLGVYAEAVSKGDYREAKLRTLLDTLSQALGPDGDACELRWRDPAGAEQRSTALVLVSNNPYLLGPTLGSGTRPRLDTGTLGLVDFHPPIAGEKSPAGRWRELTTAALEIECEAHALPVGIDGEPVTLQPPLRFRARPKALRVRICRDHPGASPSANVPRGPVRVVLALLSLAWRDPGERPNAR